LKISGFPQKHPFWRSQPPGDPILASFDPCPLHWLNFQRRRFNVAVANPNGIESSSPALADEIGLRGVIGGNRNKP